MLHFLLMIMVVALVGCGKKETQSAIIEKAIRHSLHHHKLTDKLTVVDLEMVKELNFINSKITDVGLKEVAKLKRLEQLFLNYTKITDVGLKEIAKMQQLKALDLGDTQVTKAGVAELQKALPKCSVLASNPKK